MGSLEYYLLLIESTSRKRLIKSLDDHQHITTHLFVNESHQDTTTQKKNHELVIEVHGSHTQVVSKSLTLSSNPVLTRVLSGIRILSGHSHEATLTQRSILLSDHAAIAQIPLLDVHTNDTKASHSANIVSITPEETFYMMSRGISDEDAKNMKIVSLIREVVSNVHLSDETLIELMMNHRVDSKR
jgi:Fe-S cluster assembly scaffold protein SufB